jgi:hypothetical protein
MGEMEKKQANVGKFFISRESKREKARDFPSFDKQQVRSISR